MDNRFSDIPSDNVSRFLLNFTNEFLGNSLDEKLAEILNINLIFLLPYSPDLNHIEDVWRKIKNIILNNLFKGVNELNKSFLDHFNKIINKTSFYDNWLKQFIPTVANIK